jgi:hypothetical protein
LRRILSWKKGLRAAYGTGFLGVELWEAKVSFSTFLQTGKEFDYCLMVFEKVLRLERNFSAVVFRINLFGILGKSFEILERVFGGFETEDLEKCRRNLGEISIRCEWKISSVSQEFHLRFDWNFV